MARSMHFARDDIAALALSDANFKVDASTSFLEAGLGAAMTVKRSVEFPAGVFTQVKWSGGTSIAIPDGALSTSDFASVSIPRGSQFWTRGFFTNPNGFFLNGFGSQGTSANGDLCNTFDGDRTMSGTVSNQFDGFTLAPYEILGMTTRPSVLLIGTSRMAGLRDTQDASGDIGIVARSVGQYYGYANYGIGSDSLHNFVASHAKRIAGRLHFTHIVIDMANDNIGNLAQIQADLTAVCGYFPGAQIILVTSNPSTSGAWTLANQTDQTIVADYGAWNAYVRANPPGVNAVVDIASVVATGSRGAAYWNADGTPQHWTFEGIHETQFANLAIKAAKQAEFLSAIGF